MPEYHYLCKKCGFKFHDVKKIDDRYKTNCPNCGPECTGEENLETIPQLISFKIT